MFTCKQNQFQTKMQRITNHSRLHKLNTKDENTRRTLIYLLFKVGAAILWKRTAFLYLFYLSNLTRK